MHDTRLDLGVLPGGARKSERGHAYVPVQWLRRRKFLIGGVFLIAVVLTYLNAFGHVQRMQPWAKPTVDAEIAHLLRTVPGALPGRETSAQSDPLADDGHHGAAYPSRSDLTLVLLTQLQEPHFQPHDSVWATWKEWLQEGTEVPSDMHIQFLTELKRMDNGTADARLYLEHPLHWAEKHRARTPFTVFSKSYCPYSKRAKALLDSYGAKYDRYEVDLAHHSDFFASLLWDLTGHRTYPKVLEGARLLGGYDSLEHLHEGGLLHGILNGAGVLPS
ncbi:uncharacterized protein MJAP1_001140 [Malassezia japonica]|uniref:Glutaredoxin domain-containing protein n=1 Tax=Malassezia japonica TaxID=223818 RepID=A0AAF0F0G0_9BASI|nr:uncharacterized protein MJAP1_001140 [Malassezia japonica]WFD38192.1 hypothetical protein MJAP1_001140 [Malassezia japonica]